MAHSASPGSETERIYACSHCPKRYARKDYLERHELNHTRPQSVCPACGKGFARPDVLRKHLSTSCKSRRGSDGDAPAPLSTAEEDALVPRKRRRPQRRNTNLSASSPGGSDDGNPRPYKQPLLTRGYSYPATGAGNSQLDSPFGSTSGSGDRDTFNNSSALSDREDSESPRFDDEPRFAQMPPPTALSPRLVRDDPSTDVGADGPARAGASLDLPLAPAFAATPETLGSLSFTPKADTSANNDFQAPSRIGLDLGDGVLPPLSATISAAAASGSHTQHQFQRAGAHAQGQVHSGIPSVMPAEVAPELQWSGAHEPTGSVDDLFSWLFNVANPGSSNSSYNNTAAPSNAPSSAVWPLTPGLESSSVKEETETTGSLSTPPEPSHMPLVTTPPEESCYSINVPMFPDLWRDNSQDWCNPAPQSTDVSNLFDSSLRDDLLAPAFGGLGQMRLYFERATRQPTLLQS